MTLWEVFSQIVERGDIIPDVDLTPGVWHKVEFSVFTTADGVMYFDGAAVVPDEDVPS